MPLVKKAVTAARVKGNVRAVRAAWKAIDGWQAEQGVALGLAKGASDAAIAKLEQSLGAPLPDEVAASLRLHDGQRADAVAIEMWTLFSCRDIEREWKIWKSIVDRGDFEGLRSSPAKGVRDALWSTRWIPLTGDGAGDHLCADLDPAAGGSAGQIITVWHDAPDRERLAEGFAAWLSAIAEALASGTLVYSPDDHALVRRRARRATPRRALPRGAARRSSAP